MQKRDLKDILAGAVLIALGLPGAAYALATLPLGTLRRMGPGMFPAALGLILALFGLAILIPALLREGPPMRRVDYRSLFYIMASVLAFALLVDPFGLFPAIAALAVIASRADSKLPIPGTLILASGLALISVLLFEVGLGMPIEAFKWP